MVKVAVIYYSIYGHIVELARKEAEGLRAAGVEADIYQIPETLTPDVLDQLHAPPKPTDIPEITVDDLAQYDGFLFGLPSRFGTFPAQFKTFWDSTGGLWASGALHGKFVGLFVSTGTQGGGQEVIVRNALSTFVHHGLIYVPLGYKEAFGQLSDLSVPHGGSPWGAGTLAGADGSRQPSDSELEVAAIQGKAFGTVVSKALGPSSTTASNTTAQDSSATPAEKTADVAAPVAAAPARAAQQSASTTPEKKESKKFCGICTIM